MHIIIISIFFQVLFIVHVIKTGRNTFWIWIILMVPVAGSIAYLIVEILPGLLSSRGGRAAQRSVATVINPNKNLREVERKYEISETADNAANLAEEYLIRNQYDDAKELYLKAMTGFHKDDPHLMHGLARCEYGLENHSRAKEILDDLIEKNPKFENAEAHLLYGIVLDELGMVDKAISEYRVLDGYYTGAEATYRLAKLLKKRNLGGDQGEAIELLEKVCRKSEISSKHYNALNKTWIKLARNELGK